MTRQLYEKDFVVPSEIGDAEFTAELPYGPFGFTRTPEGYRFQATTPQGVRHAITSARAAVKRLQKVAKQKAAKELKQQAANERMRAIAQRSVAKYLR